LRCCTVLALDLALSSEEIAAATAYRWAAAVATVTVADIDIESYLAGAAG
jgi:hypothetical protein